MDENYEMQLYKHAQLKVIDSTSISIYEAVESQLVNQMTDEALRERLKEFMKNSYITADIPVPNSIEALKITLNEIIHYLRYNKTNIRIDEIEIAFKNGIHKKYGEYYRKLSAVEFCMFITGYLETEKARLHAISKLNESSSDTLKVPTEEEIELISMKNAHDAFEMFKNTGTSGRYGPIVFLFLERKGIIQMTDYEKMPYFEKAKELYKKQAETKYKGARTREERDNAKRLLTYIDNEMKNIYKEAVKALARTIVLDDLFAGMKLDGATINDLFNS